MRYVKEHGLRQREAAATDTTHINMGSGGDNNNDDDNVEEEEVNETSAFLSSSTNDNNETTTVNQSNSVEVLRRRVKSLDKLNVHEEAVETCDRCPDICFTTLCGIHFHPLNNIILLIWSSGVLFFLLVVGSALSR